MWIREALGSDLPELCANMRALDAREIYALRDHADPVKFAGELYLALSRAAIACVAGVDGRASAISFFGVWPGPVTGHGQAVLFATREFPLIVRDLIVHVRSILVPDYLARGFRRVEARVMDPHRSSRALLRRLGMVEEGRLEDFGPDGLAYRLFAWRASDFAKGKTDVLHAAPASAG